MYPLFSDVCTCICMYTHALNFVGDGEIGAKLLVWESKPVVPIQVKTEVKEEAIPMTKAETRSAQPTTGMSSHSITAIILWS